MGLWGFFFFCFALLNFFFGVTYKELQKSWAEILCFGCTCLQLFWGRVVMRKLLNIPTKESDYSADTDSGTDTDTDLSDDGQLLISLFFYLFLILIFCSFFVCDFFFISSRFLPFLFNSEGGI